MYFIPGSAVSLALVGRYSAHATALHAQDCPDWKLEKAFFPTIAIKMYFLQEMLSLRSWPGIMAHMLRHYAHKTVLTGGRIYIYIYIILLYKCICSREYPGLSFSSPGWAL